jgi:hypothetical protein
MECLSSALTLPKLQPSMSAPVTKVSPSPPQVHFAPTPQKPLPHAFAPTSQPRTHCLSSFPREYLLPETPIPPVTPPPCNSVPSAVPVVHQVSRAANSITVSWPQPDQTNGNILDYQLRYYDQVGRKCGMSRQGWRELQDPTTGDGGWMGKWEVTKACSREMSKDLAK